MTLSSFADLAARLATADADMKLAEEAILEKACQLIEDDAKAAIGTYKYSWPQLAEATQEQRVALGYSANEPLLRTGDLRDSIGHVVSGNEGFVGTNDPVAPFHEFGTSKIPPRPFLGPALEAVGPKIEKMAGRMMMGAMLHGGPNYHELKTILHEIGKAYHELKEAGERFLDEGR
jgi:HK97 gp10 family phage protein